MFEFFKKIFKRKPKEVEPPDLMEARAYLDSLKPKALKMFADGELTVKDILKLDMHWPVDADLLKKIQEHEEVDQTEANELLRTSCKSLNPETAERHVPAGFYVALDVPAEKRNEFKTYFDRSRNLKETCERMTHYQRRAVDAALDLKVAEELLSKAVETHEAMAVVTFLGWLNGHHDLSKPPTYKVPYEQDAPVLSEASVKKIKASKIEIRVN